MRGSRTLHFAARRMAYTCTFAFMWLLIPEQPCAAARIETDVTHDEMRQAVFFGISIYNNNYDPPGVIYDAFEVYNLASLAQSIYDLPHNRARYTSVDDLTGDWGVMFYSSATIYRGWHMYGPGYDPLHIGHSDDPNYNKWYAGGDMGLDVRIPMRQLDSLGDGWNAGPDDYRIVFDRPIDSAGIAYTTKGTFTTPGKSYKAVLIPEPALALFALPSAFLLLRRRRVP